MKYKFMHEHREEFSIEKMASVLRVSSSGFYSCGKRPPSSREKENLGLAQKIEEIYLEGRQLYGSPRIHGRLIKMGIKCSRKRVARLMKKQGLAAKMRNKWKRTTKPNKREAAKNLVQQKFTVSIPNSVWVSDITYVYTREGWLYVAVILDLFSRKIVGLCMRRKMESSLVEQALQQALQHRNPPRGLIHHSDRGSQYTSESFARMTEKHGVFLSMSSTGNCYDNAVAESFFHTLKTEHIFHMRFWSREEAKRSIFEYVEIFYNRRRAHSFLGYLSPEEFEQNQSRLAI